MSSIETPHFKVDTDLVVVEVAGEIDLATLATLRAQLTQAAWLKPRRIVIDLTAVTFMGAGGIGVLIEIQSTQRRHGGTVKLVGLRAPIRRVLELTGLTELFPAADTIPSPKSQRNL